jgi:MurNAc alpha-1-phosphate uridylyltransferase
VTLPVAILAGGLATRLQPLTETVPKAMVPIAGEPFVAHQLRLLRTKSVRRVVLCIGHLGERIQEFVGDGSRFGLRVDYSSDGGQLLGTGGALRNAAGLLEEAFLVIYGDSYLNCDYWAVEQRFLSSRKQGLMTVFRNQGQWDASNVLFDNGRIVRYSKTDRLPDMAHIDYGLGAIQTRALERIPQDVPFDLARFYQGLLVQGQLAAYEVTERFYEIGSFGGIRELEELLSKGESTCNSSHSS